MALILVLSALAIVLFIYLQFLDNNPDRLDKEGNAMNNKRKRRNN